MRCDDRAGAGSAAGLVIRVATNANDALNVFTLLPSFFRLSFFLFFLFVVAFLLCHRDAILSLQSESEEHQQHAQN